MGDGQPESKPGGVEAFKAFGLTLVASGLGHGYVGRVRHGLFVHLVTLALMGLAVAVAMLPPANLPMLIVMMMPLLTLLAWVVISGVGAAAVALKISTKQPPFGMSFPTVAMIGLIVTAVEFSVLLVLLVSLSSIGTITTPKDDMAPTTLEGDFVVTWKDYYKDNLPERGDVAVVQLPGVEGDRIMRIVGLPGDSLLDVLGVLTINGAPVGRDGDGDFSWRDAGGTHRNASRYIETLPGGASYRILQSTEGMFTGALLEASPRIPDGHYFVVGDNRDSSKSSWDFGMLPGLVLGDRPTVILSSSLGSRIGASVQP